MSRPRRLCIGGVSTLVVLAACGAPDQEGDKNRVIAHSLSSTVQLAVVREDGVRRVGSAVVLFSNPDTGRTFVLTTSHLLEPPVAQTVEVVRPPAPEPVHARIVAIDTALDLALLELSAEGLTQVTLEPEVTLGDTIWVVAFPWGRRRTVVTGAVSQIGWDEPVGSSPPIVGPVNLIDASVSYGMSGGGVFDRRTGRLVGIVRGYRSAELSLPGVDANPLKIRVAGETTVIPASDIICFVGQAEIQDLLEPGELRSYDSTRCGQEREEKRARR